MCTCKKGPLYEVALSSWNWITILGNTCIFIENYLSNWSNNIGVYKVLTTETYFLIWRKIIVFRMDKLIWIFQLYVCFLFFLLVRIEWRKYQVSSNKLFEISLFLGKIFCDMNQTFSKASFCVPFINEQCLDQARSEVGITVNHVLVLDIFQMMTLHRCSKK